MAVKLTELGHTLIEQKVGMGKDWNRPSPTLPTKPSVPEPVVFYALSWDPNSSSYHSLSDNNRWATSTTNGLNSILSNVGFTTGKYYFEITGSSTVMFGIAAEGFIAEASSSAMSPLTWVFENRTGGSSGFYKHHNGVSELYGNYVDGTEKTWGVSVDFDLKKIWLRNSDGTWNGNPETNSNPAFVFEGEGPFYIVATTSVSGSIAKINTGVANFTFPTPGGYNTEPVDLAVAMMRQEGDNTGYSVAVGNTWAVVGSPFQDWDVDGLNQASNAGSIFVYKREDTGWEFNCKISAPNGHMRTSADNFGYAVAVDNNRIFIGAPGHKTNANGTETVNGAGAIYVYEYNGLTQTWDFIQLITPTGTDTRNVNDNFGTTLTVKDGVLIVGVSSADYAYTGLTNSGACWVFILNGTTYEQIQYLYAGGNTRNADDKFGYSVAVHGDWLAVGTPYHSYVEEGKDEVTNAGAVHVFAKESNNWIYKQKLVAEFRDANELWGENVVISDKWLVVGAPSSNFTVGLGFGLYLGGGYASVFKLDTSNTWTFVDHIQPVKTNLASNIRFSETMLIDGDRIYVSSPVDKLDENGQNSLNNSGGVWVFKFNQAGVTVDLTGYKVANANTSGYFTPTESYPFHVIAIGGGASGNPGYAGGGSYGGGGGSGRVETANFTTTPWQRSNYSVGVAGEITNNGSIGHSGQPTTFGTITALGGTISGVGNDTNPGSGAVAGGGSTVGTSYGRDDMTFFTLNTFTPGSNTGPYANYGGAGVNLNGSGNWGAGGFGGISGTIAASGGYPGIIYFEFFHSRITYFEQEGKLTGSLLSTGRVANQRFGQSISAMDPYLLVGISGDSYDNDGLNPVTNAGSAALLQRGESGFWFLAQKFDGGLTNMDRNINDALGASIHTDGSTLAVGATGQDYDHNGHNYKTGAGAVYVWNWNGVSWVFGQKIVLPEEQRVTNNAFGARVQISGNYMAVASLVHNSSAGAVWMFEKVSGVWTYKQKLVPTGTNANIAGDQFGQVMRLVDTTLVVGTTIHTYDANGANSVVGAGAIWVFELESGNWNQKTKLVATSRTANDNYACSIDIVEDVLVVGAVNHSLDMDGKNNLSQAGAAWLYRRIGGVWTYQQKISGWGHDRNNNDYIGGTVAISGNYLMVGSPGHSYNSSGRNWVDRSGAVYAYVWDSGWKFRQKITTSDVNRQTLARFGSSIAIDGNSMVIGAPGDDWATMPSDTQTNHFGRGAIYTFERINGVWTETQRITASGTNAHYNNTTLPTTSGISYWKQPAFGWSVSLDNGIMVVGQPYGCWDENGANQRFYSGAAYTFVKDTQTNVWTQEARLTSNQTISSDRTNYDLFGWSVDVKNSIVIIGSPNHDYDQSGDNSLTNAGAAYIWRRELDGLGGYRWTSEKKLVGFAKGRNANDRYGEELAADGEWMFVGSPGNQYDSEQTNYRLESGAVYAYRWVNQQWTFMQKITPTGTNARNTNDRFGKTIAVDGNWLAISSPYHSYDADDANAVTNSGAVWLFEYTEIGWTQRQKITATGTNSRVANTYFGNTLSLNNDTLAVGVPNHTYDSNGASAITNAGAVWIFTRSGTTWSVQARLTSPHRSAEQYGYSVDVRDDMLVIGAPYNDTNTMNNDAITDCGAVYAYKRTGSAWNFLHKLVGWGHDRNANDWLAWSMASHNNTLVVSATRHAYDVFGQNYLVDAGAIYVWTYNNGSWVFEQKITPTLNYSRYANDRFGYALTIHENIIAVGIPNHAYDANGANSLTSAGAVMIFTRDPALPIGSKWSHTAKIVSDSREANQQFGYNVSLYSNTLFIGAPGATTDSNGTNPVTNAGAVWVFDRTGGVWTKTAKLTPTGTNSRVSGDQFGSSVSLYNDIAVIGAPYQDYDETGQVLSTNAGAVWVFTKVSGVWTQKQKIVSDDRSRMANDQFGSGVSGSGTRLAVGAPYHAYDNYTDPTTGQLVERNFVSNAGAVYVWNWNGTGWDFEQKLIGTHRGVDDYFGGVVHMWGDYLAVGAVGHQTDGNGTGALVGAGAVWMFERTGTGQYPWVLVNKLVSSTRSAGDQFGYSISVYDTWMAVGAPGDGSSTPGKVSMFNRIGGSWQQTDQLNSSGLNANQNGDQFGWSVDLKQNVLVVGAPQHDYDQDGNQQISNAGAAWIYTRTGSTWTQLQKVVSWGHDRNTGDRFTYAMDYHNGTLAASAPFHDYDQDGNNFVSNAGAVYMFNWTGTTWTFEQKIVPTGLNARNSGDNFGITLAIRGNLLAVSSTSHQYDANSTNPITNAGAVWIFERTAGPAGTNVWSQTSKLTPTGTNARNTGDQFGYAVVVDDVTSTVIVGSPYHDYGMLVDDAVLSDAGAVWVFRKVASTWTQTQKLAGGNTHRGFEGTNGRVAGDNFGWSLSYHDHMLLVGSPNHDYDSTGENSISNAGAAYVFTRSNEASNFTQIQKISGMNQVKQSGDQFGYAISGDNTTLAVSAPYHSYDADSDFYLLNAGAVFVYIWVSNAWTFQQKITPDNGNISKHRQAGDLFGYSVSLDGERLVVGSPNNGWDDAENNFTTNAGAVYVFDRHPVTSVWEKTTKLLPVTRRANDQFGWSVSCDGDTIVVGAPAHDWNADETNQQTNAGAVWVFFKTGSVWSLQQKITPDNDWRNNDAFGTSVSVSGDILVVGAPGNSYDEWGNNALTNAGAVFVYTRSGGVWTKQDKIVAVTTMRDWDDSFSAGLTGYGNWLLVGAPQHDWDQDQRNSLSSTGAVWAFEWTGSAWAQRQKITPTGLNSRHAGDKFGYAMASYDTWMVVSAPYHDFDADGLNQMVDSGAVWIYRLVAGVWTLQQKIVAPILDRAPNERFGFSLDMQGDMFIVGSPYHTKDISGNNELTEAGAAWVYQRNASNVWIYKEKLVPMGTNARNAGDHFGWSVTIDADHAYVGAPEHSWTLDGLTPVPNTGAVWMFTRPGQPSVTLGGGNPSTPATIDYVYDDVLDTITSLTLTSNGTGYTQHPEVLFIPETETSSAYARLAPTTVSSVVVTNPGYGFTSTPSATVVADPQDLTGNSATVSVTIAATGVARVALTNVGSGYTDIPTVTFNGGDGTGVVGHAVLRNTSLSSINIVDQGSNYTTIPPVTITGNYGSIATTQTHMGVSTVEISNPGSNFQVGDIITLVGGTGIPARIMVDGVDANGSLTSVSVHEIGSYTVLPGVNNVLSDRVEIVENWGNVTETPVVSDNYGNVSDPATVNEVWGGVTVPSFNLTYKVESVEILDSSGFNIIPSVMISGNATLTASLTPTILDRIVITDVGSSYRIAPTVVISGGGATINATGTAILQPTTIESITLTNNGSSYTRTPTIQLTGGGGSDVTTQVYLAPTTVATVVLVDGGYNYQAWSQSQKINNIVGERNIDDHYASVVKYDSGNLVSTAPKSDSISHAGEPLTDTGSAVLYRKDTNTTQTVYSLFDGFSSIIDSSSVVNNIVSGGRHFTVTQWIRFGQHDNKTMHTLFAFARPDAVLTLDPVNDVTYHTASYAYTGGNQSFLVPYDIYGNLIFTMSGGGGGGGVSYFCNGYFAGGVGGTADRRVLEVTPLPGETLTLQVGDGGHYGRVANQGGAGAGGWPNGSPGGCGSGGGSVCPTPACGGGGGGASRVVRGSTVLVTAGGGNGGGAWNGGTGGAGGNRIGVGGGSLGGGASTGDGSGKDGTDGYINLEYYTGLPQRQKPTHLIGLYKGRLTYTNLEMDLVQVSSETLADDNWHHIATTYNRSTSTLNIYVDGVVKMTVSNITVTREMSVGDVMTIGAFWDDKQNNGVPKYFYKGNMSKIGVWRKVLTSAELTTVRNGSPLDVPSELQGYWVGDTITNNTFVDQSNMSHNAVVRNISIVEEKTKWTNAQTIKPSELMFGDEFGHSADIYGDWAIIGSKNHGLDTNNTNHLNGAGAAWVYKRNTTTGIWSQTQKLTLETGRAVDQYFATSISMDNDHIAIGIPGLNNGQIAIYKLVNGNWNLATYLSPLGINPNTGVGSCVSMDGNYLAVGAPYDDNGKVALYENSNGIFHQIKTFIGTNLFDEFGGNVVVKGNKLFISAIKHSYDENEENLVISAGAVYVYGKNANDDWVFEQKLVSRIRVEDAQWGCSLDAGVTRLVIGSENNKQVEIFNLVGNTWVYADHYSQPEIVDQRTAMLLHFEGENNSTIFTDEAANYTTQLTYKSSTHLVGAQYTSTHMFDGRNTLEFQPKQYAVYNANNFETRFYDSDFTIEWFEYPVSIPDGCSLMTFGGIDPFGNGEGGFVIGLSGNLLRVSTGINSWDIGRDKYLGWPIIGQWQHVAITRYGNTWKTWRNGVEQDTWIQSGSINISSLPIVFNNYRGNSTFEGSLAGLRITIGVSRYNDNFTSPTSMFGEGLTNDSNWDFVTLLMPLNNGDNLVTTPLLHNTDSGFVNTNAYLSTNASAFGNSSLYLNGGTTSLSVSCGSRSNISRQNFTIEFMVSPVNSNTAGIHDLVKKSGSWNISLNRAGSADQNAGTISIGITTVSATSFTITGSTVVPLNIWTHIALVGIGYNLSAYVNGQLQGTVLLDSPVAVNTNAVLFGGQNYKGYIDEFRMLTGEARYTNNFSPPVDKFAFNEMTNLNVGRGSVLCVINDNEFITGLPRHNGNNKPNESWTNNTIHTSEFTNLKVTANGLFEQWQNGIDGWVPVDTHCMPGVSPTVQPLSRFGDNILARNNLMFAGLPNYYYNEIGRHKLQNSGAVFIYSRDYTNTAYQARLISSNRLINAKFGYALSYSENKLSITSPDFNITGVGYGISEIYDKSGITWTRTNTYIGTGLAGWGTKAVAFNNNRFAYSSLGYNNTSGSPWPTMSAGGVMTFNATGTSLGVVMPTGTNVIARGVDYKFGTTVSTDGTIIAVGSPGDVYDANQLSALTNAGAVYTYTWNAERTRWNILGKIVSANRFANVGFGLALQVRSPYMIVGSPGLGGNNNRMDVMELVSGVWTSRFNYTSAASGNSNLGNSVVIVNSSLIAYTQSRSDDATYGLTDTGSYGHLTRSGVTWTSNTGTTMTSNMVGRTANGQFGYSVDFDLSSGILAIGCPGQSVNNAGTTIASSTGMIFTYIYDTNDQTWKYELRYPDGQYNTANQRLGQMVRVRGSLILSSGPNYNGYNNGGILSLRERTSSTTYPIRHYGTYGSLTSYNFAKNVLFVDDNNIIVSLDGQMYTNQGTNIGSFRKITNIGGTWTWDDVSGSNYEIGTQMVPAHTGGRWDQNSMNYSRIYSNGRNSGDNFGYAVTLSDDLQYLVISAPSHEYNNNGVLTSTDIGALQIYWWDSVKQKYRYNDKITNTTSAIASTRLGTALDFTGSRLVAGAYLHSTNSNSRGLVQTYSYSGSGVATTWITELTYQGNQNSGERAGYSVSLLSDTLLVAGVPRYDTNLTDSGVVQTWNRISTTWTINATPLMPIGVVNGRQASDYFGFSVGAYGNRIAIGSPRHSYDLNGTSSTSQMGCVYTYTYNGTTWLKEQKIIPTSYVTSNQQFGYTLALRDTTMAVGGVYGSSNNGTLYVIEHNGTNWNQTYYQNSALTGDQFGWSLAIVDENQVIGGTYLNDGTNNTTITDSGSWVPVVKNNNIWKPKRYKVIPPYNGWSDNPTEVPAEPTIPRTFLEERYGTQILNWGGRVVRNTTNARFDSKSYADFSAKNTMLYTAYSASMSPGTGSFCAETRVRFEAFTGSHQHIMGRWNTTIIGLWIIALHSDNTLQFYMSNVGWIPFSYVPVPGVWYHLAAVRDGSQVRLYVNGVLTNSAVVSGSVANNTSIGFSMGATWNGLFPLYGQMEDTRVTMGHYRYNENFDTDITTSTLLPDGSNDTLWATNTVFLMTGRDVDDLGLTQGRFTNDNFGYKVALTDNKLFVGMPGRTRNLDGTDRPTANGSIQVFDWKDLFQRWSYYAGILNPDSVANPFFSAKMSARLDRLMVSSPGLNSSRGGWYMFRETTPKNWVLERSEQTENYNGGYAIAMADETLAVWSQHTSPGYPSLTESGQVAAIRYHSLFDTWSGVDASVGGYGKMNLITSGTFGGNGGGGGGYVGGAGGGGKSRDIASVQAYGQIGQGGEGGSSYAPGGSIEYGDASLPGNSTHVLWNGEGVGGTNGSAGTHGKVILRWNYGTASQTFTYTGKDQAFTVPSGVTSIEVLMWGAGGSSGQLGTGTGICAPGRGGNASYASRTISVTGGEVLTIVVGEGGRQAVQPAPMYSDTYGGGAPGGVGTYYGGQGGGRSSVIRSGVQLVVAGGGGGGAGSGTSASTPATAHGGSGGTGSKSDGGTFLSIQGFVNVRFANDVFGYSVSLGDNYAYIGATQHRYDIDGKTLPSNSGVVFMFKRNDYSYSWELVNKITSNLPTTNQYFGSNVVFSGNRVAIGSNTNNGILEVKSIDGNNWSHEYSVNGTSTAPFTTGNIGSLVTYNIALGFDGDKLVAGTPTVTTISGQGNLTNGGAWNTYTYNGSWSSYMTSQTTSGLSYGRNASDHFGKTVKFVNANNLIVSSPDHAYSINGIDTAASRGALYHWIWDPITTSWQYRNKITETATANSKLGQNGLLSINNRLFVLNNTNASVYDLNSLDFTLFGNFTPLTTTVTPNTDNSLLYGNTATTTSQNNQPIVSGAGAVHQYDCDTETFVWAERSDRMLTIPGRSYGRNSGDNFGYSVGLQANWLVIGSPNHSYSHDGFTKTTNTGAVYMYAKNVLTGSYDFERKITSSLNTANNIGSWIKIKDNLFATGNVNYMTQRGYVELFERTPTSADSVNLITGTTDNQYMGRSFAWDGNTRMLLGNIVGDGQTCNTFALTNSGEINRYARTGATTWVEESKVCLTGMTNSRNAGDKFGYSLSYNGNYLVIGSPYHSYDVQGTNVITSAGAIYVYLKQPDNTFKFINKFVSDNRVANNLYGYAVSISPNGQYIAVSEPSINVVKLYSFNGRLLTLLDTITPMLPNDANDMFGYTLKLSADRLVVGSPFHDYDANGLNPLADSGAVYVYQLTGGSVIFKEKMVSFTLNVTYPTLTDGPHGRNIGDQFGFSVDINANNDVIVGAPKNDWNQYGELQLPDSGSIWIKTLR